MKNGKRDYSREYKLYQGTAEQRHNRSERTVLRNQANASGMMHKHDGKDLDHVKPLSKGGANTLSNARVATQAANRSFSRNSDGSMKNQVSRRERKGR